MPIYTYRCAKGHEFDVLCETWRDKAPEEPCRCGLQAPSVPAAIRVVVKAGRSDVREAAMKGSYRDVLPEVDSDSFWEGAAPEMEAGFNRPNPLYYKSDKPTVDMGS